MRWKTPVIHSWQQLIRPTMFSAVICPWMPRVSAPMFWKTAVPIFCTSALRTNSLPALLCPSAVATNYCTGQQKKAVVISSKMITTANSACSASLFRHCKALIPRKRLSISIPSPKRWHQPSVSATCCCHRTWHRCFMTSWAFIPVLYLILSSLHSLNLSRTVTLNATSTACAPTTAASVTVCCSI